MPRLQNGYISWGQTHLQTSMRELWESNERREACYYICFFCGFGFNSYCGCCYLVLLMFSLLCCCANTGTALLLLPLLSAAAGWKCSLIFRSGIFCLTIIIEIPYRQTKKHQSPPPSTKAWGASPSNRVRGECAWESEDKPLYQRRSEQCVRAQNHVQGTWYLVLLFLFFRFAVRYHIIQAVWYTGIHHSSRSDRLFFIIIGYPCSSPKVLFFVSRKSCYEWMKEVMNKKKKWMNEWMKKSWMNEWRNE